MAKFIAFKIKKEDKLEDNLDYIFDEKVINNWL